MSDLISESQSLRACNLPDTPQWRKFLQKHLPFQEISTGRIYDRSFVQRLAEVIRPGIVDIVLPAEETPPVRTDTTPRFAVSGAIDSGIKPRGSREFVNRDGPDLQTR